MKNTVLVIVRGDVEGGQGEIGHFTPEALPELEESLKREGVYVDGERRHDLSTQYLVTNGEVYYEITVS